jgi:hypothetical protein
MREIRDARFPVGKDFSMKKSRFIEQQIAFGFLATSRTEPCVQQSSPHRIEGRGFTGIDEHMGAICPEIMGLCLPARLCRKTPGALVGAASIQADCCLFYPHLRSSLPIQGFTWTYENAPPTSADNTNINQIWD